MNFNSDRQRRAIFASMSQRGALRPEEIFGRAIPLPAESTIGQDTFWDRMGGKETEPARGESTMEYVQRLIAAQEQQKAIAAGMKDVPTAAAVGFQSGRQMMAPSPGPAPSMAPPEEFSVAQGDVAGQYAPIREVVPEVRDVLKGVASAAKGGIAAGAIGGALGYGLGMAGGSKAVLPGTNLLETDPARTALIFGAAGALPGLITSAREISDLPESVFLAGKDMAVSTIEGLAPTMQIAGQVVGLAAGELGSLALDPWTYGPSIHDMPGTLEYPPYYAKLPKPVPINAKDTKGGSKGFSEDEVNGYKDALSTEFGFLKSSDTQVNQYDPRSYQKVAMSENPDQPIEASQSSAFYDPRADKLHMAVMADKLQSTRSLIHDLAHSMGHFKDDPGLNEGMAEYLAVKIMTKGGTSKQQAEETVGYDKEYAQVKGLVDKYGWNSVKQVFMTTHDSSDLATDMMFDSRVNPSNLQKIAPKSTPIIDFAKTSKVNKQNFTAQKRFKEASFNIDQSVNNSGGK